MDQSPSAHEIQMARNKLPSFIWFPSTAYGHPSNVPCPVLNPAASNTSHQSCRYQPQASLPCHVALFCQAVLPSLSYPSRLRGAYSASRQRQNPCTPAHGSPKTKPGILFSPTGHTLVFRQHQRPGRSRTRLTKTKKLRVFVVKNSPQISATTHQRTEISTQHFSKNFANCSLNNATCASTIQGKWRGKEARRACQASNPRLAPPAPIHGGPGRLRPFNCAGV